MVVKPFLAEQPKPKMAFKSAVFDSITWVLTAQNVDGEVVVSFAVVSSRLRTASGPDTGIPKREMGAIGKRFTDILASLGPALLAMGLLAACGADTDDR